MPDPNTLPQILELILRLMAFEYVFLTDIQKMFLSIELELKSDRDMLRFVWGLQRQQLKHCLLYTSPSPRDGLLSRMPSSA